MKDLGEGTPNGASRYQAEDREMFDRLIVGTGCGNAIKFGDGQFMITRIDKDAMTFDLMPLLAARRYFDRPARLSRARNP